MTIQDFKTGVQLYLEKELISTTKDESAKWILGAAIGGLLELKLWALWESLKQLGAVGQDGKLDTEKFEGILRYAAKCGTLKIDIPDMIRGVPLLEHYLRGKVGVFTFGEKDVEEFITTLNA